jgi:hypothetical protein
LDDNTDAATPSKRTDYDRRKQGRYRPAKANMGDQENEYKAGCSSGGDEERGK